MSICPNLIYCIEVSTKHARISSSNVNLFALIVITKLGDSFCAPSYFLEDLWPKRKRSCAVSYSAQHSRECVSRVAMNLSKLCRWARASSCFFLNFSYVCALSRPLQDWRFFKCCDCAPSAALWMHVRQRAIKSRNIPLEEEPIFCFLTFGGI